MLPKYPQLIIKKVDVEACEDIAREAGIEAMPTFVVFKNGEEADRMEGAARHSLVELLDKAKEGVQASFFGEGT